MADVTTGDAAALRTAWMRLVLMALLLESVDADAAPVEKLRSLERIVKSGLDVSSPAPIGPFDTDGVKHLCLEEIERFFGAAIRHYKGGAAPKADPSPHKP